MSGNNGNNGGSGRYGSRRGRPEVVVVEMVMVVVVMVRNVVGMAGNALVMTEVVGKLVGDSNCGREGGSSDWNSGSSGRNGCVEDFGNEDIDKGRDVAMVDSGSCGCQRWVVVVAVVIW